MTDRPRVAAMVLARDRPTPLRATVEALREEAVDRLVLIDNDGTPEVKAVLADAASTCADCEVLVLRRNHGCSGGFEAGIAHILSGGDVDYVCGFDDDATPLPGCVERLVELAGDLPDVGAVGALSHAPDGTLAWPMYPVDGSGPAETVEEFRQIAKGRSAVPVLNLSWHGMLLPVDVIRRLGNVWGELFLQYEDIELGMRYRAAGLNMYLSSEAECLHPVPPDARTVRIAGRQIDVTAQNASKEYLTLRNGLVVRRRWDGLRFWYGTGPFVLIRGFLSSLALDVPKVAALRHVFLQGVIDAARGRLGPPPDATARLR